MSRRSSKLLPALLVLIVAGVGVAAWTFLREPPTKVEDLGVGTELALSKGARADSVEAPATSVAETGQDTDGEPGTPRTENERRQQATAEEAELREAIWLEGRVTFPEGTPGGEIVEVVALGRKFKTREMYRAKVETDGSFKVAFAPGTKSGRLDIDALHLFLDKPQTFRLSDGRSPKDIELEPFLGGALRGQLRLARDAESLAAQLVGKTVRANAWSNRWSDMVVRSSKIDKDLRFELRGLPPELGLNLTFDSDVVTKLSVNDLRAPAGETVEQVFELSVGARVRGHVRSAEGALPKNTVLEVRVKGAKPGGMGGGDRDNGKIADDGSFDLRGLQPGEITLTVSAPQRVTLKKEIGLVENGAVREGVELVLGTGHIVAGRVVWPDKSPAVDAQVVATGGGGDDDPFNPFDTRYSVRTNATGEFQIAGLNDGPYGLLAQAKPPVEAGKPRRKGQTWKARLEGVAADSRGIEVQLVAGYSVEGQVVDDVGAPVTAFGVMAMAKDEGKRSFNLSRMVSGMFKPDDGRFELGGLLEGGYTINLNVPGHDDPAPLDVTVPSEGASYTFIAPRRALISGVVVKPDGSPAPRAEVLVNGDENRWSNGGTDKADNQGKFEIKAAQTGKITVVAKLDGFAPSEVLATEVGGGQALPNLRMILRVGGRITGEVMPSRTGERVDGRKVNASQARVNNIGGDNYDTTTDRSGKFEFKHVTPGDYTVAAEAAASELDRLRDPDSKRGNDWELTELTKKRGNASVSDGGTANVVLGAPPANPVVISGLVHRGSQGVGGVRIIAQSEGAISQGQNARKISRSDDSGHYEVIVDQAGKYQVQATPTGRGGTMIGTHVDVPAAGLSGVDFALASGRIAGTVRGPDGDELGWVRLQISRAPGGGEKGSEWTGGNTQTDTEGQFEFKDLPAGEFTLEVSGSSFNRRNFEQRQYGEVKVPVTLAEGQDRGDVEIRLQAAGSLKVTVVMADGSAADGGRMTVRRTDGGSGVPDDKWFGDGEATREDLEPGLYEVRVEVSGQVSPEPERVSIVASQTTTLTMRLRPGGFVKFNAVNAQGEPVSAMATLVDGSGRPLLSNRPLRVGETSAALPPGTCRVIAQDGGGRSAEASAQVEANEVKEVTVTFQ